MANNIDERIVEMRFDNKDFEKGVSETIDSLDKLKQNLDLDDSVKGFEQLDKAASKVDLSPIEKSVDAVKVKFSALEVVAISALTRITNQAIDAGEKLVKSFTVDPILAGFDKYESKVASVQRILNSSSKNQMEDVEAALAKIEWFTNETSYQYDQMVSTLGSFAASGIELKEATNMIIGIADAAAISGVNAKDASHAMLGFQRAISSGYLSLGIWNSYLKTAGMQSQVFIDQCIEMGVKTGTLRRGLDGVAKTAKGTVVDLASFASTLNEKWLDSETLTETMSSFSVASDQLYAIMENSGEEFDMVSQAIDKYGDSLDQFSLKAFQAGQETKTWGDTVEYVRGTVAQGWSKTWELIFGNYKTATAFFSSIVEDMYNLFVVGGEIRNDFLEMWAHGIFDEEGNMVREGTQVAFLNGIINVMRSLSQVVTNVREAIGEMIPDWVIDKVMDITLKFHEWSVELAKSFGMDEEGNYIVKIADSLTHVGKSASEVTEEVEKDVGKVTTAIGGMTGVLEPTAEILEEVNALAKAVIRGDYGNGATRIEKLGNKFKLVQNRVNELLGCQFKYTDALEEWGIVADEAGEKTDNLSKATDENGESMSRAAVIFQNLVSVVKGFKSVLEIVWNVVSAVARFVGEKILPGFQKVGEGILGVGASFGDFLEKISKFISDNDIIYKTLTSLYDAVQDKLGPAFEAVGEFIDGLASRKNDVLEFVDSLDFSNIGADKIQSFFGDIRTNAGNAIGKLLEFAGTVSSGTLRMFGFNTAADQTQATFGALGAENGGVRTFVDSLITLGGKAGTKATEVMTGLGKAGAIFKEYWDMVLKGELTRGIRNSFISASGSLFSIFGADNYVKKFYEAEWDFGKAAGVMAGAMEEVKEEVPILSSFIGVLEKFKNFFQFGWQVLTKVAGDILKTLKTWIGPAVDFIKNIADKIRNADLDSLLQIGVLVTVLMTVLVILRLMNTAAGMFKSIAWFSDELYSLFRSIKIRTYAGVFLEVAIAFGIIAFAMTKIAEEYNANSDGMIAAIVTVALVIGALIGLMALIAKTSTFTGPIKALQSGGAVFMLVMSLGAIIAEIYALSKIGNYDFAKGFVRILSVFVVLAIMVGVLNAILGGGEGLPTFTKMAGFFAFILALKTGVEIMVSLISYPWDDIYKGLTAMFDIAMVLIIMSRFMSKIKLTSSVGLVALVGSIWLFVKVLDAMKNEDFDAINGVLLKLVPLFLTIITLSLTAAIAGNNIWGLAAVMGMIVFTVKALTNSVKELGAMDPRAMAQGVMGIVTLLSLVFFLITVMTSFTGSVAGLPIAPTKRTVLEIVAMFTGVGVAMLGIAAAMKIIASIDKGKILAATASIVFLMASLAGVMHFGRNFKASAVSLIAFAGVIAVVALSLWALQKINWAKLLVSAVALGGVIAAIGYAMGQMSRAPKKIGSSILMFIEMASLVAGVAYALSMLATYDWKSLLAAAGGMSLLIVAIGFFMTKIKFASSTAKLENIGKGWLQNVLPMIALMYTIATTLRILLDSGADWTQLAAVTVGMSVVLIALAETMKIITSISYANRGAVTALKFAATSAAEFGVFVGVLIGVLSGIGGMLSAIDDATGGFLTSGLDFLVLVCQKIGEAIGVFISALGEGLTARLPKAGENLSTFAENLSKFIEVFKSDGVDWGRIKESVGHLSEAIIKMANASYAAFDSEAFNEKFVALATALKTFYAELNDEEISVYKAKAAAEAVGILAAVEPPGLYSSDGKEWDKLATGLSHMGQALKAFAAMVGGEDFDPEAAKEGMGLIKELADIATEMDLSKFSGWDALIGLKGETKVDYNGAPSDIADKLPKPEIISQLKELGIELKALSNLVTEGGLNPEAAVAVIGCIEALGKAAESVPKTGGWVQQIMGVFEWATLLGEDGTAIQTFGEQVNALAAEGAKFKGQEENFKTAIDSMQMIIDTANTIDTGKGGGIWQMIAGDNSLKAFSELLPTFSQNIATFVDNLTGYDATALDPALKLFDKVSRFPKLLKNNELSGVEGGANTLGSIGYALVTFSEDFATMYTNLKGVATNEDGKVDTSYVDGIISMFNGIGEIFTPELIEQLQTIGHDLQDAVMQGFSIESDGLISMGVDGFMTSLNTYLSDQKNEDKMKVRGRRFTVVLSTALHDAESLGVLRAAANDIGLKLSELFGPNSLNVSRMKTAGQNLMDGLIAGISSRESLITAKVQSIANIINSTFAGAEKINSPSKVWAWYGSGLIEGLVLGLNESTNDAVGAANTLASAINGELTGGLDYGITPVVDLSNVSKQAGQLGSMFASTRASALSASMEFNSQISQMDNLVDMTSRILGTIQNGSDLYLDDGIIAGRINRRLGVL